MQPAGIIRFRLLLLDTNVLIGLFEKASCIEIFFYRIYSGLIHIPAGCISNRRVPICIFSPIGGENRGSHRHAALLWVRVPFPIKNTGSKKLCFLLPVSGTPEGTRTPDLLIRSQSLYPTELPAHMLHLTCQSIITHIVLKCKHFFQNVCKYLFCIFQYNSSFPLVFLLFNGYNRQEIS